MKKHVVKRGECIASIAYENGFFWQDLWNHDVNSELREKRKDGYILMDGDIVFIPEKRVKKLNVQINKRHRFRVKGVPEQLRLRLGSDDFPRANLPYTLIIDGEEYQDRTDERGEISRFLAPNARKGELILRPADAPEEHYELALRGLDPVTEMTGIQARLRNLGFYSGPVNGEFDSDTLAAMQEFQSGINLERTEEPDDRFREELCKAHGC